MGAATSPVVSGLLKGYSIGMQLRRAALERERMQLYREREERYREMEEDRAREQEQEQAEGDQEFQERMMGAGGRMVTPEGLVRISEGKRGAEGVGTAGYDRFRKARPGQTVRRKIAGKDVAYELPTVEEAQSTARKAGKKDIKAVGRAKGKVDRESRAAEEAQFAIPTSKIRGAAEGTDDLSVMPQHASGMSALMGRLMGKDQEAQHMLALPANVLRDLDLPPGSTAPPDVFKQIMAAHASMTASPKTEGDKVAARAETTRKATRFAKLETNADKLAAEENDLAAENEGAATELEQISEQLDKARKGGEMEDPVFFRSLKAKRAKLEATVRRNQSRIQKLIKERERVQVNKDKIYGKRAAAAGPAKGDTREHQGETYTFNGTEWVR